MALWGGPCLNARLLGPRMACAIDHSFCWLLGMAAEYTCHTPAHRFTDSCLRSWQHCRPSEPAGAPGARLATFYSRAAGMRGKMVKAALSRADGPCQRDALP